jgi:thiol-disulfide isomerase/thioredoxin
MFIRVKFITILVLLFTITSNAQKNFTYSPENPKPGDVISIFYEPAGDLANTTLPLDAAYYQMGNRLQKADDIFFVKKAGKLTATITTDTAANFIYFSFSADQKFDNNFNNGYFFILNENDKPRKGANINLGIFYQSIASRVGAERNNEKAINAYNYEFSLYPENKKQSLVSYLRALTQVKKDEASNIIQTEIETLIKTGLNEEFDYSILESLYQLATLPEQAKLANSQKKEKFPNGKWVSDETMEKFYQENDPEKKKVLLEKILMKIETDENWSDYKPNISYFKLQIASTYSNKRDWPNFKKSIEDANISDKAQLASLYNNAAWEMQKTNDNLIFAEEFSRIATNSSKELWNNPTGEKPAYLTQKQWLKNNEYTYALYADTYAMVMYRMGNYKKGLLYAREASIVINKGIDPEQNNTYALLAEKSLPQKEYVKTIEQFVKAGYSTSAMAEILKKTYLKNNKSLDGFEDYMIAMQKESALKMLKELPKSILKETAPSFFLLDLYGKKINLAELKGKIVVVDFWATWCGPCISSFPGMQKMVNKYKDDPNVKFIFIDTWESGDMKEKTVSEFLDKHKYTFHVLMDNDNKVVADYKVDGIPTKFVIDKNGMIRFKSIGFSGGDDKLIQELTAMIEIVVNEEKKMTDNE